jgi:hypothetical protein
MRGGSVCGLLGPNRAEALLEPAAPNPSGSMILETGLPVLIFHRRLYEGDHMRHFLGVVEGYEAGVARVTGHTWVRDAYTGEFLRKNDARTKLISLSSGTLIAYQLPSTVDLDSVRIETSGAEVCVVDDSDFRMDLSEGNLHAAPKDGMRRAC